MSAWRRSLSSLARGACVGPHTLARALVVTLLMTLAALWPPSSALAQHAPPDVAVVRGLEIPRAPEGFVQVERGDAETGTVLWELPERAQGLVEPLFETWDGAVPRIRRELGIDVPLHPIRIRVGVDPDQMQALAPIGAPPPSYAVGVAYPGLSLILLTLTAPETWQRPELHQVLVHELSHIALHEALAREDEGAGDAPLWFVEGVAIYQARERSIERVQTLWEAAFRGGVIPLDDLDERFPERAHAVSLAYAQSADFVGWLLRRSGPEKLGQMLERMRRGQSFETAVSQTWSARIGNLEIEWREDLSNRFGALPMFASGSVGWVLAGLLVVAAVRKRKQTRERIEQRWAEEDAKEERIALALARHRARLLARERARRLAEEGLTLSPANDGVEPTAPAPSTDPRTMGPDAILTSYTHEKPTTTFVVGPSSTATAASAPPSEQEEPPFERDLERGDRPLH